MNLRPYQEAAKVAIQEKWNGGTKKVLLVLPTGTGKTIVFCKVIEDEVREGSRVLVLAHRSELLDQAADKLEKATGLQCAVEKAEQSSLGSSHRVVVGSVQTLTRESRLAKFSKKHFDTIIVDEAHHAISESYQRVLNHFDGAKVLGVTATPDRGDMKNLGSYFDDLAYEYSLSKAINQGYLVPLSAQMLPIKIDLSYVRQQAGDYSASELGSALDPYLEEIAEQMAIHAMGRKTVVFLPLITTSQRFTELLRQKGFSAVEVNGESPDRAEILADFDAGRYNVLCNSMLLTEGWDCPSVDCIVVLRPTKVRALYSQMIGRGTRLYPGKKDLLILDFLWNSQRHPLIHPTHLVAKTDNIAERMMKSIEDADGPLDLSDAESEAERDVIAEREAALRRKIQQQSNKKAKLINPIQFEMSILADDLMEYEPTFMWQMGPATDKQISTITKYGISAELIDNKGKAALIIDRLIARSREGLSTPKQAVKLDSYGFKNAGQWTFDEATKVIKLIAANAWRVPRGINPATYKPQGS